MKTATIIVALALVPAVTTEAATERARYLMGTVCEVAAQNPEQIELAFAEAARIEAMLSTWTDQSELARVNRGAEPGPELRALLDETLRWAEKTGRAFDPRIGHLVKPLRHAQLPLPAARGEGTGNSIAASAMGDFEEGAFGKGYALDRMLALIDGETLINFGGQIVVRGTREVTIADPARRDEPVLAFTIENASLSTSSGSHILDPRTGRTAGERGSVSVIAGDALTADILSTALYVMGEDDGLRWAAANHVAVVFINPNRDIRLSPAARERVRGLEVLDRHFSLKE